MTRKRTKLEKKQRKALQQDLSDMTTRDASLKPSVKMLVARLQLGWDEGSALVVADWCAEHGLDAASIYLRHGPSNEARAMVDALSCALGVTMNPRMLHWREWAANTTGQGESAVEKAARRWTK